MMNLLIKDAVFDDYPNKKCNKSEFITLFFYRTKILIARSSFTSYQYKAYKNSNFKILIDYGLSDIKIDEKSDIDILEKADLFNSSEIYYDSNNNE